MNTNPQIKLIGLRIILSPIGHQAVWGVILYNTGIKLKQNLLSTKNIH